MPQRHRVTVNVGTDVRTKQSFKRQCDINDLVARHLHTGLADHLNTRQPLYGDDTAAKDLLAHRTR